MSETNKIRPNGRPMIPLNIKPTGKNSTRIQSALDAYTEFYLSIDIIRLFHDRSYDDLLRIEDETLKLRIDTKDDTNTTSDVFIIDPETDRDVHECVKKAYSIFMKMTHDRMKNCFHLAKRWADDYCGLYKTKGKPKQEERAILKVENKYLKSGGILLENVINRINFNSDCRLLVLPGTWVITHGTSEEEWVGSRRYVDQLKTGGLLIGPTNTGSMAMYECVCILYYEKNKKIYNIISSFDPKKPQQTGISQNMVSGGLSKNGVNAKIIASYWRMQNSL
jgi:hypothetical protein